MTCMYIFSFIQGFRQQVLSKWQIRIEEFKKYFSQLLNLGLTFLSAPLRINSCISRNAMLFFATTTSANVDDNRNYIKCHEMQQIDRFHNRDTLNLALSSGCDVNCV